MQKLVQKHVVVVALFMSIAVFAKQPPIAAAPPIIALFPVLLDNPDFFELTGEQKKAVALVGQQSAHKREGLDQAILDLREELREALLKYPVNTQLVQKTRDALVEQEKARLQLSIDCAAGLQKALSKEQWKTLLELSLQ